MCNNNIETLVFRNQASVATVVTNGQKTAVYGPKGRKFFPTLLQAIAFTEAHGYHIETEEGWD